ARAAALHARARGRPRALGRRRAQPRAGGCDCRASRAARRPPVRRAVLLRRRQGSGRVRAARLAAPGAPARQRGVGHWRARRARVRHADAGMSVANLLVPAIRWDAERGWDAERPAIERALALGVGGFILFGGEQDAVRQLTKELRLRSTVPLLIAADMERGAGQQFAGATGLPPLAAIASLNDPDLVRRAARLTAREARTLGVNWDFAPVCDVDL